MTLHQIVALIRTARDIDIEFVDDMVADLQERRREILGEDVLDEVQEAV